MPDKKKTEKHDDDTPKDWLDREPRTDDGLPTSMHEEDDER